MEIMKKFDPQINREANLTFYEQTIAELASYWPLAKKFVREQKIVLDILRKSSITHIDRMNLLSIYQVPYHTSGKIEGAHSCDSSAHGCRFCWLMREAAKSNPDIICGECYDFQQEIDKSNVGPRHALNMLIMKMVEFEEDELAILPINGILRGNSAGDMDNAIQALNFLKIAETHPYVDSALWAKNTVAVGDAVEYYHKPENLRLIQSSPIIGKPSTLAPHFDNTFTVYRTEAETLSAIANGANACNGAKCADCGYMCYRLEKKGGWKCGTDIAETLRIKKPMKKQKAA